MDQNDIKVRKQWLGMLILNMLINSGSALLHMWLNPAYDHMPQLRYVSLSISLIGTVGFGYCLYRCIYKKPGTKLLTFCLIMTVVSLAATPLLYVNGKMIPDYIPYYGFYLTVTHILGFCWIFFCWKMLKTNKKLKKVLDLS